MQKFYRYLAVFCSLTFFVSCDNWNTIQNPYYLLNLMKKVIKGEMVEDLIIYFDGAKMQCLYASQNGVNFLREKLGKSVDYLEVSEELYEGESEYQFFINDSRTNNALFDVTVTCRYDVMEFGRKSSYCRFSDLKNLTDNEEYPYSETCLELGVAPKNNPK
ncbi:MAG: hypothetical protein JNM93_12040 [Bacteriovoracaceae bacterium]|nr:hypothetical protein [Bacteriovoracaceae bacterium]